MKIKSLVAAAIVAASGVSSFAVASVNPPLTFTGNTASFSSTVSGAFTDTWTFSLPTASNVGAAITNVALSFGAVTSGSITSFAAFLDTTQLVSTSGSAYSGPFTINTQVLAGGNISLPGSHTLLVSGNAGTGASYAGSMALAPVPEPETYAMLLVGLGLMGAVVRRRNKSDSDQA